MSARPSPLLTIGALLCFGAANAGAVPEPARPRHLIYLHGQIIQEEQSRKPRHPEFGVYELDAILEAFRSRGFTVHADIRPKGATVSDAADRVVAQVRELLAAGVAAHDITIVGASMGGGIALLASARLANSDLRIATLGVCLSSNVAALGASEGRPPAGHLLAIREASDASTGNCAPWQDDPKIAPGLDGVELEVATGLGHGFLYRPLPVWVNPVVEWAAAAPVDSPHRDRRGRA